MVSCLWSISVGVARPSTQASVRAYFLLLFRLVHTTNIFQNSEETLEIAFHVSCHLKRARERGKKSSDDASL